MLESLNQNQAPLEVGKLVRLLALEEIETQVFYGESQDLGFPQLFGGQVLGQALMAACKTVAKDRFAHSFHGYFLRPGDPIKPIYYEVDLIRTGKSFSTRRVLAKQKGLAIFAAQLSFQKAEAGLTHSEIMPQVPEPDTLKSDEAVLRTLKDKMPPGLGDKLLTFRPIEIRSVEQTDYENPKPFKGKKYFWTRVKSPLPDDPLISQAFLAYASDFGLSSTSLLPHGLTFLSPGLQLASLDHTMWFHRPFRFEGWFLHALESTCTFGGRGLNRGMIFAQDGTLVASMVQEGLIRKNAGKKL
jgi:acyl-CoA thioesterase-2